MSARVWPDMFPDSEKEGEKNWEITSIFDKNDS